MSRSIARRVLEERVSLLLPNVLEDARFSSEDSILASGIRSAMCAPALVHRRRRGARLGDRPRLRRLAPARRTPSPRTTCASSPRSPTWPRPRSRTCACSRRAWRSGAWRRTCGWRPRSRRGLLPSAAPRVPGWDLAGMQPALPHGGRRLLRLRGRGRAAAARPRRRLGQGHRRGAPDDGAARGGARRTGRSRRSPTRSRASTARSARTCPSSKYVTFFLASLDPATGRLDYVNAGHNPPILVRATGEVETLTDGGLVLGHVRERAPTTGGRVEMRPGDTLVVYSDGVTETWDPDGEEFGEDGPRAARGAQPRSRRRRRCRTRSCARSRASSRAPGPPTTARSWC